MRGWIGVLQVFVGDFTAQMPAFWLISRYLNSQACRSPHAFGDDGQALLRSRAVKESVRGLRPAAMNLDDLPCFPSVLIRIHWGQALALLRED
jgi:hypothetical protein